MRLKGSFSINQPSIGYSRETLSDINRHENGNARERPSMYWMTREEKSKWMSASHLGERGERSSTMRSMTAADSCSQDSIPSTASGQAWNSYTISYILLRSGSRRSVRIAGWNSDLDLRSSSVNSESDTNEMLHTRHSTTERSNATIGRSGGGLGCSGQISMSMSIDTSSSSLKIGTTIGNPTMDLECSE